MTVFLTAYAITGGAMAYFCGVRSPLAVIISVVFWPIVAVMVLIDMATDRDAG
jgi:hypothetical protein